MQPPLAQRSCLGCGSLCYHSLFPRGHTDCRGAGGGSAYLWYAARCVVCVTRECMRGVSLRVHFAVGFLDCKIDGAFVMRGTVGTVMMGALSITFCCCMRVSLSLTPCSSNASAGIKIFLIFSWRSLMSRRPFCVALAIAVASANSSVSERKC